MEFFTLLPSCWIVIYSKCFLSILQEFPAWFASLLCGSHHIEITHLVLSPLHSVVRSYREDIPSSRLNIIISGELGNSRLSINVEINWPNKSPMSTHTFQTRQFSHLELPADIHPPIVPRHKEMDQLHLPNKYHLPLSQFPNLGTYQIICPSTNLHSQITKSFSLYFLHMSCLHLLLLFSSITQFFFLAKPSD